MSVQSINLRPGMILQGKIQLMFTRNFINLVFKVFAYFSGWIYSRRTPIINSLWLGLIWLNLFLILSMAMILMDKTMDDKLKYTHNYDKQNPFVVMVPPTTRNSWKLRNTCRWTDVRTDVRTDVVLLYTYFYLHFFL